MELPLPKELDLRERVQRRSQLNEEQDLSEPERLHPMSLSSLKPKCVRFISVGPTGERHPFLDLVEGSRSWLGRCEERGGWRRRQNLSEKRVGLVSLHRLSLPLKKHERHAFS